MVPDNDALEAGALAEGLQQRVASAATGPGEAGMRYPVPGKPAAKTRRKRQPVAKRLEPKLRGSSLWLNSGSPSLPPSRKAKRSRPAAQLRDQAKPKCQVSSGTARSLRPPGARHGVRRCEGPGREAADPRPEHAPVSVAFHPRSRPLSRWTHPLHALRRRMPGPPGAVRIGHLGGTDDAQ